MTEPMTMTAPSIAERPTLAQRVWGIFHLTGCLRALAEEGSVERPDLVESESIRCCRDAVSRLSTGVVLASTQNISSICELLAL